MHAPVKSDLPAIAGGEPAKRTPFGRAPRYGEEELQQLREALEQGSLFYAHGNKVKALEKRFAEMNGVPYAVACSSGTAAIHAALIAVGISPGDEVITSPITDMGSLIPILYQGAVPVFAELHPRSYTLQPESVEARITDRTRAVLAVHLWGNACDLDALRHLCAEHHLWLIEDCAQAFGCTYRGEPIGTLGDVGCFSLNEFKHISCGDGGIVVTRDEQLARRLRLATDKCYNREPGAVQRNPVFLANNYRMTELQGAVALAQLEKLESIVARRRRWCQQLSERLQGVEGLLLPQPTEGCEPSWWFYMMRVVPEVLGANADEFAEALRAEGLPVSAHYIGQCVYEYPLFTQHSAFERGAHAYTSYRYGKGLCPIAEEILDTCVMLPVNEAYTDTDLEETVYAIRRVAQWFHDRRGR
ncbi:MAG: DegT/DnrJ/EryC1/StrS family aminotransferase [Armatimonadota bacterium]|nr:DegT/DnrJ/EryC1/StrS family aminotransferase [Armatimonadota bacterium]